MSGLSGKPDTMWFPGRFWEANTVADFWSKWNPGIHYAYFRLMQWVRRKAGTRLVVLPTILAIFVISGLWHDGVIWLVSLGREGFQYSCTIFFVLNAIVVIVEKSSGIEIPIPQSIKKMLTFGWIIGSFRIAFTINYLL